MDTAKNEPGISPRALARMAGVSVSTASHVPWPMPLLLRRGLIFGLIVTGARLAAASYHVDSREGDDAHNGMTPEQAWRSIERVNQTTFAPGDRVLLRAGGRWEGMALRPLGSGTPDAPILLGRYGDGPAPALHGRGRVPWVVGGRWRFASKISAGRDGFT